MSTKSKVTMISWLKRQLRKITAFFIALYLTIVTIKDVEKIEQ